MAKRFKLIKFIDYDQNGNEKELILQFRLGPKAIDLFKTVSGKSLDEENIKDLGIKGLVQLLYAGCKDMKHDLTLDMMWELVDNYELDELGDLMNQIFPQTEGEIDPNAQK